MNAILSCYTFIILLAITYSNKYYDQASTKYFFERANLSKKASLSASVMPVCSCSTVLRALRTSAGMRFDEPATNTAAPYKSYSRDMSDHHTV